MRKTKESGITLIALIITIIIMLILVGVTVSVALNGGLFDTAKIASLDTRAAAVDEKVIEWKVNREADKYTENKTAQTLDELLDDLEKQKLLTAEEKQIVKEEGQITIGTRTIVFQEIDKDLELLRKYFASDNLWNLIEFHDGDYGFECVDNDIIPNASTSIESFPITEEDNIKTYLYIKYNEKVYNIIVGYDGEVDGEVESVSFLYKQQGREGEKVLYSYDGTEENKKEWTILYDYGEYLEIVSPDVIGELTLGGKSITEAIDSYNNAITIINNYCDSLITNPNKISVRSLGSNPNNPSSENSTLYTSEVFEKYYSEYRIKSQDMNYEQDIIRMQHNNILINGDCWLASRFIWDFQEPGDGVVSVRCYYENNYLYSERWLRGTFELTYPSFWRIYFRCMPSGKS